MSDTELDKILQYDPIAETERLTNGCVTSNLDNPASMLGMALAMNHTTEKRRVLMERGDTVLYNDLDRYRGIIEDIGFKEVLADQWKSTFGHDETFYIYARHDGLLLCFDTYSSTEVNGAKLYYNWKPHDPNAGDHWKVTSSGHWTDDNINVGYRDAREALRHAITNLTEVGSFVRPWVEQPFLWLLNYDETKVPDYDYKAINADRIARLPQWVLDFVAPELTARFDQDRQIHI